MKVILLKDVGGIGQRGAVKDVSDGHALNFLIPRGLAMQATPEKLIEHARRQKEEEGAAAAREEKYKEIAKALSGTSITVAAKANEHGHLYKTLSPETVAAEIGRIHKIALPKGAVVIGEPIRTVGDAHASVRLGAQSTSVTVRVTAA